MGLRQSDVRETYNKDLVRLFTLLANIRKDQQKDQTYRNQSGIVLEEHGRGHLGAIGG